MITIKDHTEYRPKLPTIFMPDDCNDVQWFRPEQAERQQDAQATPAAQMESQCQ